jgi:hypothetical protein
VSKKARNRNTITDPEDLAGRAFNNYYFIYLFIFIWYFWRLLVQALSPFALGQQHSKLL